MARHLYFVTLLSLIFDPESKPLCAIGNQPHTTGISESSIPGREVDHHSESLEACVGFGRVLTPSQNRSRKRQADSHVSANQEPPETSKLDQANET